MKKRTVDVRGRVNLGHRFAGTEVVIDDTDPNRVTVTPLISIPKREQWLYRNRKALASVRRGVFEARAGKFVKNPPKIPDLET